MFVFRREDLPADPVFPADLEQLGYFIDDKDQIRKITNPDKEFQFKINRNNRWNEVQRGAMNECIRKIVLSRLQALGLTTLYLPIDADPTEPRVPILVSSNLSSASRVIVVFGEPIQDLGIWAYRSISTDGINVGSAVSLAQALLGSDSTTVSSSPPPSSSSPPSATTSTATKEDDNSTALILANTGQLLWHCGTSQAITHASWIGLPRASAAHPPPAMSIRNKIRLNENWQDHVSCVFQDILSQRGRLIRSDAVFDIIGLAEGGLGVVRFLEADWSTWSPYISSIQFTNPLHFTRLELANSDINNPDSFAAFLASRGRAYVLSEEPLGTPVQGFNDHGCNCYSGGEALNIECLMPGAWRAMVDWLAKVRDPGFSEDVLVLREVGGEELGEGAGEK